MYRPILHQIHFFEIFEGIFEELYCVLCVIIYKNYCFLGVELITIHPKEYAVHSVTLTQLNLTTQICAEGKDISLLESIQKRHLYREAFV